MTIVGYFLLGFYLIALTYITLFCLVQFHLLYHYRKWLKSQSSQSASPAPPRSELPVVTIQLPIFNEKYVVYRLIDNIISIDYPKDKLQIQILDDSTDETLELTRTKASEYTAQGYDIEVYHRKDRKGYKAGALQEGLKSAKGDFIAIFDADFLPRRDFLMRTIPHLLQHDRVGVVQTRWEHINEDYSLITKLQAFQLNVHFTVEQGGRKAGRYFLQFNGTAGVWRKSTILDAGGWHADTLTEDLDLSYRAQLRAWEIIYLEDLGSPAELPAEMYGLKSQQFRWMKGGAETAVKVLPSVWKSQLPWHQKLHGTLHLLSSGVFVVILATGLLTVPLILWLQALAVSNAVYSLFLVGLFSLVAVYYVGNRRVHTLRGQRFKAILKFIFLFPMFLALSMGLSLHNSIAVIQGYRGKKSAFIRTPKFNLLKVSDTIKGSSYLGSKLPRGTLLEGLLAVYFVFAIYLAYVEQQWTFVLFHGLLALGFGIVFSLSLLQAIKSTK